MGHKTSIVIMLAKEQRSDAGSFYGDAVVAICNPNAYGAHNSENEPTHTYSNEMANEKKEAFNIGLNNYGGPPPHQRVFIAQENLEEPMSDESYWGSLLDPQFFMMAGVLPAWLILSLWRIYWYNDWTTLYWFFKVLEWFCTLLRLISDYKNQPKH